MSEQPQDTQPKEPRELLKAIRPLSDERRLEARERAKGIVVKAAGKMPVAEDFRQHTEAKYPPWMNWLINGLCLMVLLAAFAPSAIRLYQIGSVTFADSIPHAASASVAGLSILLLSEAAMVLFSIAGVVMVKGISTKTEDGNDTPEAKAEKNVKRLLSFSQFIATLIAVVGNGQVSLPGHITNPFAWIEAFAPSILIYSTSAVLKAQLLTAVERRHANTRAYQMALNAWNMATSQPESDARFRPALHNALRDFLREDNVKGQGGTARREYMTTLVLVDWQRLVKRELDADEWYADPDAPAVSVVSASTPTSRQTADTRQRVYASVSSEATDNRRQTGNGHVVYADAVSVQTDEDTQPTDVRQSGAGYVRVSSAVEIAKTWLKDNPDMAGLPLRQLEELIGVGKDSIAKARKELGG